MSWLPDSESMLQVLINATWQSALLAAIVFVVIQLVGRWIAPSWRVALSTIPLLRLVVLVLPVTAFSLFQWVDRPFVQLPLLIPEKPLEAAIALPQVEPRAASTLVRPFVATEANTVQTTSALSLNLLIPLTIAIWISGVAILSAHWFWCAIALRRLLGRGVEVGDASLQAIVDDSCRSAKLVRRVSCILTDEEIGPATCGFLRPKIVISKNLARELPLSDLKIVIAHEVEHIRRCDCLLLSLGHLAVILHWFNPLAYMQRGALRREIELAVDASTLGNLGRTKAKTYGELLIRIAGRANPPPGIVQMAGPGTNLRRRIDQLMRWRKPRKWQFILGAVIACLLAMAGLSDGDRQSSLAQELANRDQAAAVETSNSGTEGKQSGKNPKRDAGLADQETNGKTLRASGRVVDANGKPVAGARLFAEIYTSDDNVQRVSIKANEKGEFSIEYPPSRRQYESYHTWAYAEGHSIRVVNFARVFAGDVAGDVEIRLPPNATREFEILLPSGEPCVDAVVRPRHIYVPNGTLAADEPTGLSAFLPEDLKPLLTRRTDTDGRVTIEAIPLALLSSIEVETPEYGRQQFRTLDETLRLSSVGKISGVLMAESPEKYAGTKLHLTTPVRNYSQRRITWGSYGRGLADVELDKEGRFEVPAIASGFLRMDLAWDADSVVHPIVRERRTVRGGETLNLMIEVQPTILVSGMILTADTREPVVSARISHSNRQQTALRIFNYVETDENGRYKTRLPAGKVKPQVFAGVASPYDYPRLESIEIPADAKEYEVGEILVHPKRLVKGTLLDDAGDPIPKATVVLHTGSYRHVAGKAETKPDGTFEMRVRGWSYYTKLSKSLRDRWYWATLDRPAANANPPQFTQLTVVDENPDAFVLQRP